MGIVFTTHCIYLSFGNYLLLYLVHAVIVSTASMDNLLVYLVRYKHSNKLLDIN